MMWQNVIGEAFDYNRRRNRQVCTGGTRNIPIKIRKKKKGDDIIQLVGLITHLDFCIRLYIHYKEKEEEEEEKLRFV